MKRQDKSLDGAEGRTWLGLWLVLPIWCHLPRLLKGITRCRKCRQRVAVDEGGSRCEAPRPDKALLWLYELDGG